MKFILVCLLMLSQAYAHEKNFKSRADKFAFGSFSERSGHPWPFPLLSIGHNMQSYQNYGSAYWHDGLDIRAAAGQPIYTSIAGKVVNVENYNPGDALYWEVAILDAEGLVWKYHHVAKETISQEIQEAFKKGGSVPAGTLIGNVIKWPVSSFGETYHHLHMLIVGADGRYINPFLLLEPLNDTKVPVIQSIGIAKNHKPISGNEVRGEHALYVEASDLVYHEKFILPPHKISYRLDQDEEKLMWEFIHLPSGKNDTDYIEDFYMKGTCGNYSCRKFYFNLNFSPEKPRGLMNLSVGQHEVEVTVEDVAGNKASKNYKWNVL